MKTVQMKMTGVLTQIVDCLNVGQISDVDASVTDMCTTVVRLEREQRYEIRVTCKINSTPYAYCESITDRDVFNFSDVDDCIFRVREICLAAARKIMAAAKSMSADEPVYLLNNRAVTIE